MRIKILRIILIITFIVIVVDVFYLQAVKGRFYYNLSKNNRIRVVPLEGFRGRIKDRNGTILADNRISFNVSVIAQEIEDFDKLFDFLSATLKEDRARLVARYRQRKFTPFTPVIVAEDVSRQVAFTLEENKYRFPSLLLQEGFKRIYPLKNNSAHVLGYVGKVNRRKLEKLKEYGYTPRSVIGYTGVEEFYDSYLNGAEGGQQVEVNSKGRQVRLLSIREPDQGEDISLTLDQRIQAAAMQALDEKRGAIIMMDIHNGEILGMTSSPSYDPNVFVDGGTQEDSRRRQGLFSNQWSPLLNRTMKGVYPPGSVFKAVIALAGLDSKKITIKTTFKCDGFYELGGMRFGCTHVHGDQNVVESLAHSCNVYYYHLGGLLGPDEMYRYVKMFGLGELTYVDLPYESTGNIPSRKQYRAKGKPWYGGETLNFSIGQGAVMVTPLQLVKMMATIATDGREVSPHLIKSISGVDVTQFNTSRQVEIGARYFAEVKKGLRAAVAEYSGTAHVLNLDDLYIAGKTGTAQTSGGRDHHAWFVGYVKGEKDLAFCVFLEHGGSSQNACLLARQFLLDLQQQGIL